MAERFAEWHSGRSVTVGWAIDRTRHVLSMGWAVYYSHCGNNRSIRTTVVASLTKGDLFVQMDNRFDVRFCDFAGREC